MPFDAVEWPRQGFNAVRPTLVPMIRRRHPGPDDLLVRLKAARVRLEAGWIQASFRSEQGSCLLDALDIGARTRRPLELLRLLGFASLGEAWEWNDRPWRLRSQVIGRVQNAIVLREKELADA